MATNDTQELLRLRTVAHGIGATATPLAAVERLLALQSQDFAAARWAIGIRTGATDAAVTAAYSRGELVRAWTMRGTLFTVAAVDLGWILSLTAPRMLAQAATRRAQLGLDEATIEKARGVVTDALTGGKSITREGFMALLAEHDIAPDGQRGYHVIAHLAQTGTLCWGPISDGAQHLVLQAEWIPAPRVLERDEALGEFIARYLRGHGPASIRDFAGWAKLTLADARRGLAVAGDRIRELPGGSGLLIDAEADATPPAAAAARAFAASVHALPGFDEYYLGYTDRSAFIDPEWEPRIVPGGNGVFQPTIVAGGRVVGTWRRRVSKAGVRIDAVPFRDLSRRETDRFDRAAEAYAAFAGLPRVAPSTQ